MLVLLLVGCWSAPRPTGPAALLRRHHAPGDVLRICQRGDGVLAVKGYEPGRISVAHIEDERLLAVEARRLELRRDTQRISVRLTSPEEPEPVVIDRGRIDGTAFAIDDRNRRLDVSFHEPTTVDDSDASNVTLTFTPNVNDFIHFTYPERPIRRNETFPLRYRETVRRDDKVPVELAVDVTFTVRNVTPDHVELTCKGTIDQIASRWKQTAKLALDVDCRARIDRRDGRTARWWIDTKGVAQLPKEPLVRGETHFDVTIGQTPDAAEVCARAASTDASAGWLPPP